MTILIPGLILFIGTHAYTMARGPRVALIGRIGEGRYKTGYSVLTAIGFVLIVYGYHAYRANGMIPIWSPPMWTRHLAVLLNLFAFISLAAMGPRPSHIQAAVKHPMLLGIKIWSTAHLTANGDLGSILLFGSFLGWAVAARSSLEHRHKHDLMEKLDLLEVPVSARHRDPISCRERAACPSGKAK